MSTIYEVPLTPSTPQILSISLLNAVYQFTVRWCPPATCWMLDIADASQNPLIQGIALVTGCNLLGQFAYIGIGGGLVVQTDNDPDAVPDFDTLGDTGHLYFVVN